jgi:DNA (cytosine-5)-methyltransferase 1
MRFLSVCSGIEAASVAFEPLGWKALAFSEIEAFPRAVLQHHYPDVPLHGDFTKLKDEPWIVDADMLCGGTPCQAFSVAGLRQSLADDRGNLTLQFVLLANAIDHLRSTAGTEPAWILWENVPGVLSTRDNAFGAFLGGLCGSDTAIPEPANGWADAGVVDGPARCCAWRVMDAQHFGLAQRRKRVFVLAKGGAGRWSAADALLPIIESSRWHPAPSRSKGEGVAAATAPSLTASGRGVGRTGESRGQDPVIPVEVCHTLRGEGFDASEDGTGRGVPLVMAHGQANAEVVSDGEPSLTCNHEAPILVRMREGKEGGGKGPLVSNDQSLTLATANDQVLAFTLHGTPASKAASATDLHAALRSRAPGGSEASTTTAVQQGMQVRRLTPVECERLQGFPDGYTYIPWRGKPNSPDGPRYKALGNSWAVPVVRYIGEQIKRVSP